jgi:WD40 repeat protein
MTDDKYNSQYNQKTRAIHISCTVLTARATSGHTGGVSSTSFSPDGLQVVSGSRDKTVKIWDTVTGAVLHTLKGECSMWCSQIARELLWCRLLVILISFCVLPLLFHSACVHVCELSCELRCSVSACSPDCSCNIRSFGWRHVSIALPRWPASGVRVSR